jgi:hypothetical protein
VVGVIVRLAKLSGLYKISQLTLKFILETVGPKKTVVLLFMQTLDTLKLKIKYFWFYEPSISLVKPSPFIPESVN